MAYFHYNASAYPIRADLGGAYQHYWQQLASPGSWFTGLQRVAIAAEVRHALSCPFCKERKGALSPYNFLGQHTCGDTLDERLVDAVHRIITDQSRITQAYIDNNTASGFSEEQYVELVGIAVTVFSIDEFNRALGLALEALPEPLAGEPTNYRPKLAARGTGFVSMLPAEAATGKEQDLWVAPKSANVLRALSLVPNALREWQAVGAAQYLSVDGMMVLAGDTGRSINRMQIELVAGRVSSYNECFY